MIQESWITKSFEGLVKAGSFIYIHLYVEKNVIENTKVERYREESMIGFGMRILYREPKPEAKEFLKSLYGICFLIFGIMIILAYRCIRIYWGMRRELKVSRLHAHPESYDYNLMEAWKCLEKLLPSKMTKKQKESYERYKMFLRTQMGSFHANELEMRRRAEVGEKDTAFNHLLYFIQYQRTGHIEQANEQIRKAELDILKEHLDMGNPQDYIAYRNVELELLRQTGAERSKLEANVQDTLAYIRNSKMPDRNRCMFEASVARVIWSLRLNPVHILQALNADKELIRQFPMPARYHCYKNIQSFFEIGLQQSHWL